MTDVEFGRSLHHLPDNLLMWFSCDCMERWLKPKSYSYNEDLEVITIKRKLVLRIVDRVEYREFFQNLRDRGQRMTIYESAQIEVPQEDKAKGWREEHLSYLTDMYEMCGDRLFWFLYEGSQKELINKDSWRTNK